MKKRRGSFLPVRPHVDEPNCSPSSLKSHLEETNKQVERLQQAFEKLGKHPARSVRRSMA
jgi:ferritin-like metal-binding protein YciE